MNNSVQKCAVYVFAAVLILSITSFTSLAQTTPPENKESKVPLGSTILPDSARQQIAELLAEKESRTPAQRKIGSSLVYAIKMRRGVNLTPNVQSLRTLMPQRADGRVDVEIRGKITKALIAAIEKSGGKVIYGHINGPLLRVLVSLNSIETLAARTEVKGIHETIPAQMQQQFWRNSAESMRSPLFSAVQQVQQPTHVPPALQGETGTVVSEGVKAHRADDALHQFGATGAGVKIGVLSDSDDFKEQSISTGDLPPDTVTVPGQDGRPGSGEGTAMMEIIHDVAPAAKLFFATAFNSPESYADNIRALRFTYGCDIIVDNTSYFFESPYQDDIIAHAVNDVVVDGAMYFSAAGDSGNFTDGTSGTWEGDFKKAKHPLDTLPGGYEVHNFGLGVISDRTTSGGGPLILHWSDPGSLDNPQAADDYDLFLLDANLRNVLVASTDIQDGTGLPFEFLGFSIPEGFQVVVARKTGATDRAIHVALVGGHLALSTSGATFGHNSAASAFSVGSVDVAQALGGAFTGGPTTQMETASSDGFRRVFFDQDGNPYKPGKYLFRNGGGQTRKKPDMAAADGVSTSLPASTGFNPFFGTSAAAPHAAGIAALLKSVKPTLKANAYRAALTKSALDIEAPGIDHDSGFGIVDAVEVLNAVHATPIPFLELGAVTPTEIGDGDGFLEPGESASLLTQLINLGGASTINLVGELSTSTPGVTITNASSTFPSIPGLGGSGSNDVPYAFTLSSGLACGTVAKFNLKASYSNGSLSPQNFAINVQSGKPNGTPTQSSYTGPVTPIPDGVPAGVNVPLSVSGFPSALAKLAFSIDGSTCTTATGATTVGIDHSWVGDLIAKLTSPSGTTVMLFSRAGGELNSSNNFCQTVLDDSASSSIQNVLPSDAPFTGTFKPAQPLAGFNGEDPNGTWVLNVSDNASFDTGNVRAFSLIMSGFVCD
jgi:subtilisin-like proprotein convertase family protein